MSELITRNGGAMSSENFMRLVKCVISDRIVDGCAITKSGANIYIAAGHIVAGGALVEVTATTFTVSSGGELVLRINTGAETQAQIITRSATTLTRQDLTNGGSVYELQLAKYTFASGAVSSLTVTVSGGTGGGGSSPSPATPSSGTTSGTLTSKVSSTASSPTTYYSATYTATRSGSGVNMTLTFSGWLHSSSAKLGTGVKLTVYARVNGGAWKGVTLKQTSDKWTGTSKHTATLSLSTATTAKTAAVEFYVTRAGSTYSGSAGTLGSSTAPKSYSATLP